VPDQPQQPDPFEILGLDPEPTGQAGARPGTTPSAAAAGPDPVSAPVSAGDEGWDDGDFVEVRAGSTRGGGRRWGLALLGLLVVLVVVVGAGVVWVRGQIDPGDPGEAVAFTIPAGSTTSDIASALADKKIVTNATVFEWYLRLNRIDANFQAGDYDGLRVSSSMGDVVDVLKAGPVPPKPVSFLVREGLWESETRQLVLDTFPGMDPAALDAALAGTHPSLQPAGSSDLEGFLFPATYQVPQSQTSDPQALVDQMVKAFDATSTAVGLPDATATLKGEGVKTTITPYQALVVASLVESEAKVPEDRAKIARVIYNRLDQRMTLGIDAAVLYALQDRKAPLTDSQLKVDSPYNLRVRSGLPPTPINSPGQASIDAALHPADGDWTYYVLTDQDGHHYFTNSYSDFQRAVADAKARGVF
jgi:UPF0755 protein